MGFKIGWVIYRVRVLLTDLEDPENSLVSVLLIYDALTIARMTRQYSVYFAATSLQGGGIHFNSSEVVSVCSPPFLLTITMFARLSVLATLFVAAVSASNVIELNPDNFDSIIGQGKPALVELWV